MKVYHSILERSNLEGMELKLIPMVETNAYLANAS